MSLQRSRRLLSGSVNEDGIFSNQDLRNAIAMGSGFSNCTFRNCRIASAKFDGSAFVNCHFEKCDLKHASLVCRFTDCSFVDCDLDNAVLATAILERTRFENCRLEYSVFSRATIIGGGFLDCNLHGAYFDLAESAGVDFSGSNFWGLVMPMSCAMIVDNRFDHRQVHMMLALACAALIDKGDRERLEAILDPKVRALVQRLVARQAEGREDDEEIDGTAS